MAVVLASRGKNLQEKEQQFLQQSDFHLHVSESEQQIRGVLLTDVREGKEFKVLWAVCLHFWNLDLSWKETVMSWGKFKEQKGFIAWVRISRKLEGWKDSSVGKRWTGLCSAKTEVPNEVAGCIHKSVRVKHMLS